MKRPAFALLLLSILTPAFLAQGQEAETPAPIEEAFKENWVPPGPVYTPRNNRPERAPSVAAPTFSRAIPQNASAEELDTSRVLTRRLPVDRAANMAAPARARLAGLFQEIRTEGGQFNAASAEAIGRYLDEQPDSPVRLNLLIEQGETWWRNGYFLRALEAYQTAWDSDKDSTDPAERRTAEEALAWLLRRTANLGDKEQLDALIQEASTLRLGGYAAEALTKAKEIQWFLENQAEQNVFCGFTAANQICVPLGYRPFFPDVHDEEEEREFIENGLSLYELAAHSHEAGGDLIVIKREAGAPIPVPSVIHWNFNHYSAITEQSAGGYRVQDVHLGFDAPVSEEAINFQSSGYFLIPEPDTLPAGYTRVSDEEAKSVYGRHCNHGRDDEGDDPSHCHTSGHEGMASYAFRLLNPGLRMTDTPIKYATPYGPDVIFQVNYDQRSALNLGQEAYGNFGPRWSFAFNSYVDIEGSTNPTTDARVVFGSGTFYDYEYNQTAGTYEKKYKERPQLDYINVASGGPGYALTSGDGSQLVFTQPVGSPATRFLLKEIVDPQGNALTLEYDGSLRLSVIRDAQNRATVISYTPQAGDQFTSDTTRIRKVTDPFGREAKFLYNSDGQLWQIIDPEGIVSEFDYAHPTNADFITSLTTPYGTTTFEFGELPGINQEPGRYVQATDPLGQTERAEGNDLFFDQPSTYWFVDTYETRAPTSVTVDGQSVSFLPQNENLQYRNTYFWTKEQFERFGRNPFQADSYNFLAVNNVITGTAASVKKPDRSRVFFNYPGQQSASAPGDVGRPSKAVSRIEGPDGTPAWRMRQWEYDNPFGQLTGLTDPLGRQWEYEYHANGIDLAAIKVLEGGSLQTVVSFSNYVNHQPQTITEASGTVTTVQYNSVGQPTLVTVSKGAETESTRYTYDSNFDGTADPEGYLIRIEQTDPNNAGQFVTLAEYSYLTDGQGDLVTPGFRTVTDAEGYTVTLDYDNFDRVTLVTHPDSSFEQYDYKDLDLTAFRDRNGHWTRYRHDSLRRVIFEQAPDGGITGYEWYANDTLRKLIDPMGNRTEWLRDAQGKVEARINPDGTRTEFTYEPLSARIATMTMPNDIASGQPTSSYRYYLDNALASVDYTDPATDDETFAYNDDLGRLTARTDGLGTTSYSYTPFSASTAINGEGRLYEVDGPWAHDTIRYAYDFQGRMDRREVRHDTASAPNDVLHFVDYEYDSLGRVTGETNGLGAFSYTYNAGNHTGKVDAVGYPNGVTAAYDYYPVTGTANDARLKEIHHTANGGATLSKFNYSYDPAGRIQEWQQQLGATTGNLQTYSFGYTRDNELRDASLKDNTGSLIEERSWQYDLVGNRQRQSLGGSSTYWHHNDLNQIEREGGAGTTLAEGTVDEPAIVEVDVNSEGYKRAAVLSNPGAGNYLFRREVEVDQGLNTIDVRAEDASGNQSTVKNYELTLPAVAKTYEYDLNGNLRFERDSGGSVLREFRWDAQNRLTYIIEGSNETEFEYDGQDRRRRIIERVSGVEQSNDTYLWVGGEIVQKRNSGADTVLRDYYWFGFSEGTSDYFNTRDHLGSVREVTASNGTTIESRYDYDLWGNVSRIAGTGVESDFVYTGHFYHKTSELHLAQYRAYNSELGRWLSRDPAGFIDGPNLYAYVSNDPISRIDPLGLWNLWNPLTYGLPSQPGENPWNPLDSSAEWGATAEGATKGAAAYADGINPFGNPWQDLGVYDPCVDKGTGASQWLGENIGRNALYTAGGLRAGQALTRGRELVFRSGGQVTGRLNLFGSRTGPLSSRFPHYHRRGPGGIGQHRPWQGFSPNSPHSGNFWNRF